MQLSLAAVALVARSASLVPKPVSSNDRSQSITYRPCFAFQMRRKSPRSHLMDKSRYSRIAHGRLPVWNPFSVSHLQRYVEQLELHNGSRVLDICWAAGIS